MQRGVGKLLLVSLPTPPPSAFLGPNLQQLPGLLLHLGQRCLLQQPVDVAVWGHVQYLSAEQWGPAVTWPEAPAAPGPTWFPGAEGCQSLIANLEQVRAQQCCRSCWLAALGSRCGSRVQNNDLDSWKQLTSGPSTKQLGLLWISRYKYKLI